MEQESPPKALYKWTETAKTSRGTGRKEARAERLLVTSAKWSQSEVFKVFPCRELTASKTASLEATDGNRSEGLARCWE